MKDTQSMAEYLNSTVSTQWEEITPFSAQEMLNHNTNNYRAISSRVVAKYADDIQQGSWEATGDTIVFSKNGTLLNGQHRLTAVIKANMPIVSLVVRGVPDSQIFDIGRKRNTKQILNAEGYTYANATIISALNVLINGFDWRTPATIGEIREALKAQNELLIESYELAANNGHACITRKASVTAATYCVLKMKLSEANKIQQIYKIANSGFAIEGLNSSPGLALRMSLQEMADGKWAAEARRGAFDMTIQAILDYQHGVERKNKYKPTHKSDALFNVVHEMLMREIENNQAKERETA